MPIAIDPPVATRVIDRLDAAMSSRARASDDMWRSLARHTTRLTYEEQLRRLYGFEAAAESAIAYTPQIGGILGWRWGLRSGLLAEDLLALGTSANQVARLPMSAIANFGNVLDALGWLYVMERSTLAFADWHARISQQIPHIEAFAYLSRYAPRVGNRWRELADALDAIAGTAESQSQIERAAHDAIDREQAWYRQTGQG